MSSTHEPVIRHAVAGDRQQLQQLWRGLNRLHAGLRPDYFQVPEGVPCALHALLKDKLGPGRALLVSERQGEVLGFVLVGVHDTPDDPLLVRQRRAYVEDMAVAEAHRRQGIGQALVRAALRWGQEQGAVQALLTVWEGNDAAEAFYRELGFASLSRVLACRIADE